MEKQREIVIKAFEYAYRKHAGSTRKCTDVPYIVHPLDVATILMKNHASENLIIAGFLHDLIEDEGVNLTEIKKLFGEEVAKLVETISEPEKLRTLDSDRRATWKLRKQHTINQIKHANKEVRMLFCADKLSNCRDLITDSKRFGRKMWEKFNAPKNEQKWYYRSLCEVLVSGIESICDLPMYQNFKESVRLLFPEES